GPTPAAAGNADGALVAQATAAVHDGHPRRGRAVAARRAARRVSVSAQPRVSPRTGRVADPLPQLALLVTAEQDATVAWRAVLEHTDDATVRSEALQALT